MLTPLHQEQSKDIHSHHSIKQNNGRTSQHNKARKENKRHTEQKGRNKTVPIYG